MAVNPLINALEGNKDFEKDLKAIDEKVKEVETLNNTGEIRKVGNYTKALALLDEANDKIKEYIELFKKSVGEYKTQARASQKVL